MTPVAQEFTLCDHFFHAAFGGSFANHQFLITASLPIFTTAPESVIAQYDSSGKLRSDGFVAPNCEVINTAYTVNTPHPAATPANQLVPNQTKPTIGDRLNDKGISWAWYSGDWNAAVSGRPGDA